MAAKPKTERGAYSPMPQFDTLALGDKMRLLGELYDAVARAEAARRKRPCYETALAETRLWLQVRSLRATLPPLRAAF